MITFLFKGITFFQLRDLLTRSILSYVEVFKDRRKLPLIEMEIVLEGDKICFSPSLKEVTDMMVSVVFEVYTLKIYLMFSAKSKRLVFFCQR